METMWISEYFKLKKNKQFSGWHLFCNIRNKVNIVLYENIQFRRNELYAINLRRSKKMQHLFVWNAVSQKIKEGMTVMCLFEFLFFWIAFLRRKKCAQIHHRCKQHYLRFWSRRLHFTNSELIVFFTFFLLRKCYNFLIIAY